MVSQESILSAVQEGLKPSQFLHKISRKVPKTYAELKIKVFSHASTDEYLKGKKGEPSKQKKEKKRKEHDNTKDAQQKKSRPESSKVPTSAPKPFSSHFNSYTSRNTSREQILMQMEGKNLLRNLGPMRALVERRNMTKYCKFHKDRGHNTAECFQLWDQIEALIQEGYLQEYISRLVTDGQNNANAPHVMTPANNVSTSNPNDGPPHEVRTIFGGHAAGDSAKASKNNVRMAREIGLGHQFSMAEHVAKLSRRENTVISFTNDEARRLIHPHIDALVVTLSVANKKVFHILIDTGSSTDILFVSVFRQMNAGRATTRPIKTPLYGFTGERVYAKRAIQLPVTFGIRPA